MKTGILLKNKPSHITNELSIGSVLIDRKKMPAQQALFTIIGIAHREIAIARLFEHADVNSILEKKCYPLSHNIKYNQHRESFQSPLYIDCSKLVIRNYALFTSLLDKAPDTLVGSINKLDLNKVIKVMCVANTIAQSIKNKFFPI